MTTTNICQYLKQNGLRCTHKTDPNIIILVDNKKIKNTYFCKKHILELNNIKKQYRDVLKS